MHEAEGRIPVGQSRSVAESGVPDPFEKVPAEVGDHEGSLRSHGIAMEDRGREMPESALHIDRGTRSAAILVVVERDREEKESAGLETTMGFGERTLASVEPARRAHHALPVVGQRGLFPSVRARLHVDTEADGPELDGADPWQVEKLSRCGSTRDDHFLEPDLRSHPGVGARRFELGA